MQFMIVFNLFLLLHRYGTWGEQTDGHKQYMFLLMQAELLQAHLELHQWFQQLKGVARCEKSAHFFVIKSL